MNNYSFSDLIDLTIVQKLAEANYRAAGMPIGIIDAVDGSVCVASGWQDICASFHRANPKSLERCMESEKYVKGHLLDGEFCKYKCKNGLWDIAIPIMVDGVHLSTMIMGQFFHENEIPDREFFIRQGVEFGFDQESYLAALDRVPVFSREKVDMILFYNKALAEFIGDLAGRSLRQMRAEEELLLAKFCIDKASVGVYQMSEEGNFLNVNEYVCQMLGYTKEELGSMSVIDIDPACTAEVFDEHRRMLYATGSMTFERMHRRKDGTMFPVEIMVNYLEFRGKKFILCFVKDITERKRAEERIQASLREKEVLLKEIHHRVKNNLQTISALLELHSDYITDGKAKDIFQQSQDRIRSMALVHQKLYQSRDFFLINFAEYVESLTSPLFSSYARNPDQIELSIDAGDVFMDIDQAIPCGLLINELLSNALKHAFPDSRKGRIAISLHADEEGRVTLTVADNGVGLPPGLNFRDTESLGLQLVNMLASQLGGNINLQEDYGVSFTLRLNGKVHG